MTKFATCLTTVVIMLASFAFLHATQARGRAGGEDSDEHVSKSEPAPLRGSLGVGQGEDYYFVTLSDIERENGIYAHYNYIYNKHKNNYLTIKWEDAELECFDLVPEGHTRGLYQTRSPEFIEKSSTVLYGSKLDHKKAVPFYAIQKAEKKNARADGADAGIVANANEEATLSSSIDTRTVYGQITLHIVSTLSPTSLVLKLANPGERPIVVSSPGLDEIIQGVIEKSKANMGYWRLSFDEFRSGSAQYTPHRESPEFFKEQTVDNTKHSYYFIKSRQCLIVDVRTTQGFVSNEEKLCRFDIYVSKTARFNLDEKILVARGLASLHKPE